MAEANGAAVPPTYLHMIHVDEEVQDLAASSKLSAEWEYLTVLFDRGRRWADLWIAEHFDDLGNASTFDVEDLFTESRPRSLRSPPPLAGG